MVCPQKLGRKTTQKASRLYSLQSGVEDIFSLRNLELGLLHFGSGLVESITEVVSDNRPR